MTSPCILKKNFINFKMHTVYIEISPLFLILYKLIFFFFFFLKQGNSYSIFYFTIQGMVKFCNRAWKKWLFTSFFRNMSKSAQTVLIKKIGRNHGTSVYIKALKVNIEKIIFFEIIIVLSKCLLVCALANFVD